VLGVTSAAKRKERAKRTRHGGALITILFQEKEIIFILVDERRDSLILLCPILVRLINEVRFEEFYRKKSLRCRRGTLVRHIDEDPASEVPGGLAKVSGHGELESDGANRAKGANGDVIVGGEPESELVLDGDSVSETFGRIVDGSGDDIVEGELESDGANGAKGANCDDIVGGKPEFELVLDGDPVSKTLVEAELESDGANGAKGANGDDIVGGEPESELVLDGDSVSESFGRIIDGPGNDIVEGELESDGANGAKGANGDDIVGGEPESELVLDGDPVSETLVEGDLESDGVNGAKGANGDDIVGGEPESELVLDGDSVSIVQPINRN
jgi:hypothetical protein